MSLKILGGIAQGFFLDTPKGDLIRPTQILLKRRLFDYYQSFDGFHFVDLCAGSGSIGLEAWSRGASKVYFSETNKKVYEILKKNIETIDQKYQVSRRYELISIGAEKSVKTFLKNLRDENIESESAIFLDPPYENHQVYFEVIKFLISEKFQGALWIESDKQKGPKLELLTQGLKVNREFSQGDSFILITEIVTEIP